MGVPQKNHLNIGLGEYRRLGKKNRVRKNLKELYKNYLNLLKENNIIPKETKTRHPRGGTLPVKPLKKTYSDRVLLVGDAAGFINPVSGEGIYYALVSGEMAAKVAAEAIENNDTSEQFLSTYQRLCENDFGRDIKLLVKSTKQWEKQDTRFLKIMSQDKKLAEMLFTIITGQKSIYELRWSLIKRYLYASLKYSLKSKNH
ncbi:MAG TPA: NAD(P)/FAD-dependent oxidoreductase [Thermoplasmatales archaeon]|nr:NAD(P)/FAD-dependent oxidoreductase [Thermoplasmatales archaeon]